MCSAVVACEKTTPAFRPECERNVGLTRGGAVGQHRVLPKVGAEDGRSPIRGHSPGSRVSVCGRRLPACSSAHAGRHQSPRPPIRIGSVAS